MSEALIILFVTVGVLAFWAFLIWTLVTLVLPRRWRGGPGGGRGQS